MSELCFYFDKNIFIISTIYLCHKRNSSDIENFVLASYNHKQIEWHNKICQDILSNDDNTTKRILDGIA